jgi:hypothetical protein
MMRLPRSNHGKKTPSLQTYILLYNADLDPTLISFHQGIASLELYVESSSSDLRESERDSVGGLKGSDD